ncbi:MAG TPA: DNA-binding protein [Opitutaceae bacterium]|jgi:predicted nucleic acid-binding protein|nr:DNA-binding protein [Opitutaceae bacterium]
MKPIADTGLLVGFLDPSDQFHAWAAKCLGALHTTLTTCEAVLAETEYLVPGSGPSLMEMVRRGTLQVVALLPAEADALASLKRYPKMQFADACVVCLSEMLTDAVVYTTDKRDFAIYRRHRNEHIKTVTP